MNRKATNIKYVGSFLKEINPLFSVGKLQRNKLMRRFIGQQDQNDGNAIERCGPSSPQKHITKESDGFHNHSNLLTMVRFYTNDLTVFPKPRVVQV